MTESSAEFRLPEDLQRLESRFSASLKRLAPDLPSIILTFADLPLEESVLSAGEHARLQEFNSDKRRLEWLVGRRALKTMLERLHLPTDTSLLRFPHPRVSLSHASNSKGYPLAIAASWIGEAPPRSQGIGIDVEIGRIPSSGTERHFLSEAERTALSSELDENLRLKLWCVKEALFKSDPRNAGSLYAHYEIAHGWKEIEGRARKTPFHQDGDFIWASAPIRTSDGRDGVVAVALRLGAGGPRITSSARP